MSELSDRCVKPAQGPIMPLPEQAAPTPTSITKEASTMIARVGKEAIDFEANAFIRNVGFRPVKLSDYKGKWIVLCFYPGDFTFV